MLVFFETLMRVLSFGFYKGTTDFYNGPTQGVYDPTWLGGYDEPCHTNKGCPGCDCEEAYPEAQTPEDTYQVVCALRDRAILLREQAALDEQEAFRLIDQLLAVRLEDEQSCP